MITKKQLQKQIDELNSTVDKLGKELAEFKDKYNSNQIIANENFDLFYDFITTMGYYVKTEEYIAQVQNPYSWYGLTDSVIKIRNVFTKINNGQNEKQTDFKESKRAKSKVSTKK